MKFRLAGAAAVLCLAALQQVCRAQSAVQAPADAQSTPQAAPDAAPPEPPKGQVLFHRSTDEDGATTTQSAPAAAQPKIDAVAAPTADDDERRAVTFTGLDLDVRLRSAEQHLAVRALLTIRNDGKTPLAHIPLQISSSLAWERIRVAGQDVAFTVATLNSDTDHTGQLHEAAVPLVTPLAPGGTVKLDVTYSGAIPVDARRLLAIGAPDDAAVHSDWDRISTPFTGLRGFGNVVWYPVSSVPVILGDGARVFDEIGEHKLRLSGARFRLHLAIEFPPGQAPTVALINGQSVPLTVIPSPSQEIAGLATASVGPGQLGFEAPSLFAAIRDLQPAAEASATAAAEAKTPGSATEVRMPASNAKVSFWALPEDVHTVEAWMAAAGAVTPFLKDWLGQQPHAQLTVLDLPDAKDAPFEAGSMLAAPIRPAMPDQLTGVLVHAVAHAMVRAGAQTPPAWLDEGVATFMSTLWAEKQHGREQALGSLESSRSALALAEPSSPGEGGGAPLASAISPAYYRTKAAYVLWMLRDDVGEPALSAALRGYNAEPGLATAQAAAGHGGDSNGSAAASAEGEPFEKLIERASVGVDLNWLFRDWIASDKGLPDLAIESVFPNPASSDSWLVAVNVANNGYAAAVVPLTVRSGTSTVTERVLLPARSKASRRILIQGKPTEVQLNDGTVPETQASVHIRSAD